MYLDSFSFNRDILLQRSDTTCSSGQLWYVCDATDFSGCCSVDACTVDKCPDDSTAAVGATTSTSKTSTSSHTTTTSSSTTKTSSSSSTTSSQTTQASDSVVHITTTVLPTATPTPTRTGVGATASPSKTPIIAGSVAGGVALILIAIMAFCCFRRRQKKKESQNRRFIEPESPAFAFYTPAGKTITTPSSMSSNGGRRSVFADVFAPFGGRYRSANENPSTNEATPALASVPQESNSTPVQAAVVNHDLNTANQNHSTSSLPLPQDPEKSSLLPPPPQSHPALHPLPGMAPTRPAYRPGMSFTINELDSKMIERPPGHVPGGSVGSIGMASSSSNIPQRAEIDGSQTSIPMNDSGHGIGTAIGSGNGNGNPSAGRRTPPSVLLPGRGHHRRRSSAKSLKNTLPPPMGQYQMQRYPSQPQEQYQQQQQQQHMQGGYQAQGEADTRPEIERNPSSASIPIGLGLNPQQQKEYVSYAPPNQVQMPRNGNGYPAPANPNELYLPPHTQNFSIPNQQNQHHPAPPHVQNYSSPNHHQQQEYTNNQQEYSQQQEYTQPPPSQTYPAPPNISFDHNDHFQPQQNHNMNYPNQRPQEHFPLPPNPNELYPGNGNGGMKRGNHHAPSASVSSIGTSDYARTPELWQGRGDERG